MSYLSLGAGGLPALVAAVYEPRSLMDGGGDVKALDGTRPFVD